MLELCRIQVDKFKLKNSLRFEDLENNKNNIDKFLINMEEIFKEFPRIDLPNKKKDYLLNGVKLRGFDKFKDGTYNIYVDNIYIGLGIVKDGTLKRDIILDKNQLTDDNL